MTKEQYYTKYGITDSFIKSDIEAVIATEIAKAKEQPQPELNPIEQAYERGEKIRNKVWYEDCWIKKHTETESIDEDGGIITEKTWLFKEFPRDWELYTEPKQVAEPTEQPAKPFDKERFERMFRAVVASGRTESYEQDFLATNICLEKLDAYYASKEGGSNG